MDDQDLTMVLKMRDEATRVLQKVEQELRETGAISENTGRSLKQAARGMDELGDESKRTNTELKQMAGQLGQMVGGAISFYALARAVGEATREYAELNSGMSDVRKTTGISGDQLRQMESELQSMSINLATSTDRLTEFASTAGRAGMTGEENIMRFTKSAAEMQLALDNIDPEAFLRMLGNTATPIEEIDKIAAALNALDDTSRTSAERIQFLATDVAAAGSMFELQAEDVLAWSTLLAETGVEAGIASSTILRLGTTITNVAAVGGGELETLAGIAGMTGQQFRDLAEQDMASAINAIIGGLGQLSDLDRQNALKLFELDQIQAQKAINPLIAKYDELMEKREQAFDSSGNQDRWANEIKVQLEKYENVQAQAQNALDNFQASIGADFAEAFTPLLQLFTDVLVSAQELYESLPEGAQKFVAFGVVGTGALASLILTFGQLGLAINVARAGIAKMGVEAGAAATGGFAALVRQSLLLAGRLTIIGGILGVVAIGMIEGYRQAQEYKAGLQGMDEQAADTANTLAELEAILQDPTSSEAAIRHAMGVIAAQKAEEIQAIRTADAQIALAKARVQAGMEAEKYTDKNGRYQDRATRQTGGDKRRLNEKRVDALEADKQDAQIRLNALTLQEERMAKRLAEAQKDPEIVATPTASFNPGASGSGSSSGSGSRSEEQRAEDQRKEKQADLLAENDMIQRQLEIIRTRGVLMGEDILLQEQKLALEEARLDLITSTGNANAQLTADEQEAVRERVRLDREREDSLERQAFLTNAAFDVELAEQMATIASWSREEFEVEQAVIERTIELKRQGKDITTQEIAAIEAKVRAEQRTTEEYRKQAEIRRDAMDRAAMDDQMAITGKFGAWDTREKFEAESIAARTDARRRETENPNYAPTPDEIARWREAANAQWELNEAMARAKEQADFELGVFDAMTSAMGEFITGAKSAKEALSGMLKALADLALQYLILIPLKRAFSAAGGFGGLFADGAAFDGGKVVPFAAGGVVSGPTLFPMAGGKTGLMGEAGPEAIMPLTRGSDGKLGVKAQGGGGQNVFAPSVAVTVVNDNAQVDPVEMGRTIGKAVEAKMAEFARKESRPGGMFYSGVR